MKEIGWKPSPLAKERLLRARRTILREPERFDMSDWIMQEGNNSRCWLRSGTRTDTENPNLQPTCGTAGCLAGTLVINKYNAWRDSKKIAKLISNERKRDSSVSQEAIAYLRVPPYLRDKVSSTLFHTDHWPPKFSSGYVYNPSSKNDLRRNASTVARFIEYIIKKGLSQSDLELGEDVSSQ